MKNKFIKSRLVSTWLGVFLILFLINFLVEFVILPYWGLDKTPKNDIYFKLWWIVVLIWLVLGIPVLKYFRRKKS